MAGTAEQRLQVGLLGPFRLSFGGANLAISGRKQQALFIYLCRRAGQDIPRDTICGLLWGDSSDAQARASLRQGLSVLRRGLGPAGDGVVRASNEALGLAFSRLDADVASFEAAADAEDADEMERAARLYGGDFAEGFGPVTPEFDRWLAGERAALRARYLALLNRLGRDQVGKGRVEDGIATLSRALALDPLQENVHRALMRAYAAQGRYDVALRQFADLTAVLEAELGIQPETVTADLAREIRAARRAPGGGVATAPADAMPAQPAKARAQAPLRPSIAVLPFRVLSLAEEAAYLGEGIAEDVIIELSRTADLMVLARQSTSRFDPETADPAEVGETLGVRYCLVGSVRVHGEAMRVSAHLVACDEGRELWAERFDGSLADIFTIQTEIARRVAATVVGRITLAEPERARGDLPGKASSYDLVLRGIRHLYGYSEADLEAAAALFEQSIAQDPKYARPLGLLALARIYRKWYFAVTDDMSEEAALAERAIALDPGEARAHCALGIARLVGREHARAGYHFEVALDRNRNDDLVMVEYARYLMYVDRAEEGIRLIREAMRLNPFHPNWYWNIYGRCLHTLGRYEEAVEMFERVVDPTFWVEAYMAACHAMLGHAEAAEAHRRRVYELRPAFDLGEFMQIFPYHSEATRGRYADTLARAGLGRAPS